MKAVWGWFALALMAFAICGVAYIGYRAGWAVDMCQVDGDIPQRERALLDERSRAFVRVVREGDTTSALDLMSTAGRDARGRIALVQLAEAAHQNLDAELSLRRMFTLVSFGSRHGAALCWQADGAARLARGGGTRSAFVILSEPYLGAERAWTFWLERERGDWRVRGVHLGLSAVAGRDGAEFWRMAVEQRQKNNTFNSTILYDLANVVFYRGEFLQLQEQDGFAAERRLYRRHEDLTSSTLHLASGAFAVGSMNALQTVDDGFVLVIDQVLPEPLTVDEAIAKNHALIDGMNASRPEWREVFDSIAAGAPTGPNQLWRTVYRKSTGYVEVTERL